MKNTNGMERERLPELVYVQEGFLGGWDILSSNDSRGARRTSDDTVIATVGDKLRALRAGEQIAGALGAKFENRTIPEAAVRS